MSKKSNKIITSKYTPASFLPLNLYRQFTKYGNVFFFMTLMFLMIPSISPFPPYAYLSAFLIVVGISIVKDGIEDFIRHRSDKKTNERKIHKIMIKSHLDNSYNEVNILNTIETDLDICPSYVEDLKVNDVVILKENEEVPGDMILLNAKIYNGREMKCRSFCFIQTSSLDGETNLKKKQSNLSIYTDPCYGSSEKTDLHLCDCDKQILKGLSRVDVSEGGIEFADISALVQLDHRNMLQTEKNIILRGTNIKSTAQVLGLIIAVGDKTKISKNQHKTDLKRSVFEKKVERKMFYIFILYFLMLYVSCITLSFHLKSEQSSILNIDDLRIRALQLTGTNYILYSYLIPLSLFVMIEIARVFQKSFIRFDLDIPGAYCRNSNLTEDIGMIDIILSDKTGTLTENKMNFNFFDIGQGIQKIDSIILSDSFFFILNLLCNNGLQIVNNNFEGISQDEVAMVEKLYDLDHKLLKKEDIFITIKMKQKEILLETLAILEFNSNRQRMSTIVQSKSDYGDFLRKNDIYIFTKGSDQRLASCLKDNLKVEVNSQYRSLLTVFRKIDNRNHINKFISDYNENLLNPEMIEKLFEKIEQNLEFSGIAYVEDRIAFKVKETIDDFRKAKIKFWMITGDKKETALSCGRSIGMKFCETRNPDEVMEDYFNDESNVESRIECIEKLPHHMIVYRAIPDKKAAIAKCLVERGLSVLSVGDGNNDVSMINKSTVGVGIKGKEGGQASLAGDFSITSFEHLGKLIFFHGSNNLIRFSKLTVNSFFKNIFLITFQFNYNFATGFSGLSLFNYYFLNYFNILFTSFIPFSVAIFDKGKEAHQFIDHITQQRIIKSYRYNRNYFSAQTICTSIIFGIIKATALYWLSYAVLDWNYVYSTIYFSWVVFLATFLFQIYLIEFFNIFMFISIFMTAATFLMAIFVFNETGYGIYGSLKFYVVLFTVLTTNSAMDAIFFKITEKLNARIH